MVKSESIVMRVAITAAEWHALRRAALDANVSVPEAAAAALRATYNLNGETK